jgi:hypothetical protein
LDGEGFFPPLLDSWVAFRFLDGEGCFSPLMESWVAFRFLDAWGAAACPGLDTILGTLALDGGGGCSHRCNS